MKDSTILILSYSDLQSDPRVYRQIKSLKEEYFLITAGISSGMYNDVKYRQVKGYRNHSMLVKLRRGTELLTGAFEQYYWDPVRTQNFKKLKDEPYDLIIVHDLDMLPLAARLANINSIPFIFDAHEFYAGQFDDNYKIYLKFNRYKMYLMSKYIPQAATVLTVGPGIANLYKEEFEIDPVILPNASPYHDLKPKNIDENNIKIIHHGAAIRARKLELMIQTVSYLEPRFTFDLMLTANDADYLEELKKICLSKEKVNIIDPVAMEKIPETLNNYDIGMFILPFVNRNYTYALPNKFFEFIQGRLAVAIGPSPDMKSYVEQYDLGVVAEDFDPKTMASNLNALTPEQLFNFKKNADAVAHNLSYDVFESRLKDIVKSLIKK